MPSNSGFSLDYDSVVRIARAVWEVERSLGIPGESEGDKDSGVRNTRLLEVNGALSGGLYPAICKDHDGTNWVYSESCFAVDSNGGTLTVGNTYIGSRTRSVSDGGVAKSVFTVQASGGGGTSATPLTAALLITSKGIGDFYNASSCLHTGAAWECGAAGSLPIDLLAIDMNGLTLDIGRRYIGVHVGETGGKPIYGVQTWWGVVTNVWCDATGLHQTKREI